MAWEFRNDITACKNNVNAKYRSDSLISYLFIATTFIVKQWFRRIVAFYLDFTYSFEI